MFADERWLVLKPLKKTYRWHGNVQPQHLRRIIPLEHFQLARIRLI
jgi:hypothetical protein